MQQNAIVKELLPDNIARLQIQRQTACGHDCSKCGGCGEMYTAPIFIEVKNSIHAEVGDLVKIEGSSKNVLGLAAIIYVIPFVLFFLFYAVAATMGSSIPGVFAVLGLALGILGAKLFNDYHKMHAKPVYVMTKV
ncbi:MAG: SoxR reducing system RseC family protein [Eubacteriales bacterium]|nr:SoxR reducing system RseC family protein [Eubacteriales bacterium]